MSDLRLAICLPLVSEMIHKRFFLSWMNLAKPSPYELVVPRFNPGEISESIASIRNQLVHTALSLDVTHILMMDSDQFYPPETIMRLLSHDLDIVGAKVHRRYPPFDPCMFRGRRDKLYMVPADEWKNTPLVEVDATGTGCILYRSEVFRTMKPPWYRILYGGKTTKLLGEDVGFCLKLRKAGYRIFVDTTIEIDHFASIDINRNFYDVVQLASKGMKINDFTED